MVTVQGTGVGSITLQVLDNIIDDDGPVVTSLHHNTTNSITGVTTLDNITHTNGRYTISNLDENRAYYVWVSARDRESVDTGLVLITRNGAGPEPARTLGVPPAGISGINFGSATTTSITLTGLSGVTDTHYPIAQSSAV